MSAETFNDVLIEPCYSEVESRSNVDTSVKLGPLYLGLPIIASNMRHICEAKMSIAMRISGGMGIMHRFCTVEKAIADYQNVIEYGKSFGPYAVGVSVGVKDAEKERFSRLYDVGARVFCLDVAHGHHINVKRMLRWMRKESGKDVVIIAGNVATAVGASDLMDWGANIVKVGIGGGSVCSTRMNTGVGVPQLYALRMIREKLGYKVPLISDGGIKKYGDIPKAMFYADAVMVAGLIAGSTETPGRVFRSEDGEKDYKVYGGSASGENKVDTGQEHQFVEGVMKTVTFRGHVRYILKSVKEGLQSACSYVGASNMKEFKKRAKLIPISGGGKTESKM